MQVHTHLNHLHLTKPLHSHEQARLFFLLCSQLNFNPEQVKDRAKKHYGVSCFNELNVEQMNWLMERLQERRCQQEQQR